jgi:5-methylcytosine-specific restriction endonuclease McrA
LQNLHVHHLTYRSHSDGDVEQNLITLCVACHGRQHAEPRQMLL